MTNVQIILKNWIKKNFELEFISVSFPTDGTAMITDKCGETMIITMNLFCDIMDADTKKILAKSNLPHDILKIGYQLPTNWTEIPYNS